MNIGAIVGAPVNLLEQLEGDSDADVARTGKTSVKTVLDKSK